MAQGSSAFEQKATLDDAQKGLLTQLNNIKDQINEFERRRRDKGVSCITA